MRQSAAPQVAQALTNDNWYGYPLEYLYQEKVRWIEAAAACPVWTSVVNFYIEEDRGHLMEEELHRSDFRVAVRGNVSSFSMPWEEIYSTLRGLGSEAMLQQLPHTVPVLNTMVKLTVKGIRHSEIVEWVAGAKLRPWVVVKLLEHLVDLGHPMCDAEANKTQLKQQLKERVHSRYGAEEISPVTMESVPQAPADLQQDSGGQKKHATPEAGSMQEVNGEAFAGIVRPNVLSSDYTSSQVQDVEVKEVLELARLTSHVTVQTGQAFWDQWQNRFVSWAYPFSLPAPVGGPDFPSKSRDRRGEDAPAFTPFAYLRSLARRVESSIRNSWDLVPGMRSGTQCGTPTCGGG